MLDVVVVGAIVLLVVATVMLVAAAVLRAWGSLNRRLTAIEQTVASIAGQVGAPTPELDTTGIVARLTAGRDGEAVRLYRLQTGAGLVEAKQAVDDLARRHRGGTAR